MMAFCFAFLISSFSALAIRFFSRFCSAVIVSLIRALRFGASDA